MREIQDFYDVIVIGGGSVGGALVHELCRYSLKVGLLEAKEDISCGVSKANSGIIHGAFSSKASSLKGQLSAEATQQFPQLARDLGFPYLQNGSLVVAFSRDDLAVLEKLRQNGLDLGMEDHQIQLLSQKETLTREPSLNSKIFGALYCPISGIVAPYEYTIALIENAVSNGLDLFLRQAVQKVEHDAQGYHLYSDDTLYHTYTVVNAAGLYSDEVAALFGVSVPAITPVKGQYFVLERGTGSSFQSSVFQVPTKKGKGILVTPTVHNNLLIGPDAETHQQFSKEDVDTDIEHLMEIYQVALKTYPTLNIRKTITTFAGLRPKIAPNDFFIQESLPGLFNLVGIDSPGLTCSPTIAKKVVNMLKEAGISLQSKDVYVSYRKPILDLKREQAVFALSNHEVKKQVELPAGDPQRFVCRCERVAEAVITDALHQSIDINTTDAVKRRTRAGAGFCQGKFCCSRVQDMLRTTFKDSQNVTIPVRGDMVPKRVTRQEILDYYKKNFIT